MPETERKGATSSIVDVYELAEKIEGIRADLRGLSSAVSRIANKQLGQVENETTETAHQVGEAIKQNPGSALAIALGLGFLFGIFMRR
jgi:ElaB/YqjD/DUF883 family membrane-anchored ribosome-binding protein